MKVSIVTVSFNQAKFLERAILSVLNQTGVSVEYIVVDAGSTDGSRRIIERYRDQLAHVIFESDEGPADGLNKGFARATGDIFGYINSDDFYLPGGLAKAVAAMERCPNASAIYGNGYIVDAEGRVMRRGLSMRISVSGYVRGYCFALQQATFYRAEAFHAIGGFNKFNGTFWDSEILVDFLRRGRQVLRFDDYIGAFRIHSESITGSGRLQNRYTDERARIFEFEKLMGRRENVFDRVLRLPFFRIAVKLGDPRRLFRVIQDRCGLYDLIGRNI